MLFHPPTPESERTGKQTKPQHSVGNQRLGLGRRSPQIWGGNAWTPIFFFFLIGPYGKRSPPTPESERPGKTKPPHIVGTKRLGWRGVTKLGIPQIYGMRGPQTNGSDKTGKHAKPPHSVGNQRLGWRGVTKLGIPQIYGKRAPQTNGKRQNGQTGETTAHGCFRGKVRNRARNCVTLIPITHLVSISDWVSFVIMVVAAVSLLGYPPTPESERTDKTHETTAQRWQPTPRPMVARPTNLGGPRMGPIFLFFLKTGPYRKRSPPNTRKRKKGKHTKPPQRVGSQRIGLGWRGPQI